ncbi:hypothetical protein [Azonexus hydrophilus]|uniref:hypothetical protein n=1 Tax=Azonexus hydrophilus TaxID=418702 RepID=UPI00048E5C11|nr:hypothetical protein [Azonexus hydrophilus]
MAKAHSDEDIQELFQAQLRWVKDGGHPAEGPLVQFIAMRDNERREERYNNGDDFALMEALYSCSCHGLKMPDWVAAGFRHGYRQILACNAKSLDEVFGRPFPKGKHLNALRKRRNIRFAIWNKVGDILRAEPGTPINRELFKRVGREVSPPVGGSEAEEIYYEAKKLTIFSHSEVVD